MAGKVVAPPSPAVGDDVIHVAVGNVLKESELSLLWALHNSGGRRICIIHVYQPAKKISISEHQVKSYHDAERQSMQKLLDKYMLLCERSGMHVEKLLIEMDSIEKGIIELIRQRGIRKLVIGGAANRSYSRRMIEPKSKKANYVRQYAPAFCQIWFVCKGHLIHTRESRIDALNLEVSSQSRVLSPSSETGQFCPSQAISGTGQTDLLVYTTPENNKVGSSGYPLSACSRSVTDGSIDDRGGISRRSSSRGSQLSSCSSSEMIDGSASISTLKTMADESVIETKGNHFQYHPSPLPRISESRSVDELYDRLQQFMPDAETSRTEEYIESNKGRKAEKQAIDAICKAKAYQSMYAEELRKRREVEEALAQGKEEVERMQRHLNEIMEDLRVVQEQKASLEYRIADSDQMVQELEHQILSAVDLMKKFKNERDDLEVKRDNAERIADELRDKHAETLQTPSHIICPILQVEESLSTNAIGGIRASREPLELSGSSEAHNIKEPAYNIALMVKYLMKSTGKAIWIATTSIIIVGLPLIIVGNQEQAPIDLESQQETLIFPYLCSRSNVT